MFKRQSPLLFISLILLLFFLLVVPPGKLVHFKSNAMALLKAPLSMSYKGYTSLVNAGKIFSFFREYKTMEKELTQLRFTLNKYEELRQENLRLKNILELKEKSPFGVICAQVIGREPTNWLSSVIIDKGSRDGIVINQTVMDFSGLIGKVIELTPASAKVLLISDVNCRVVVFIQRTREEGMLEGIGQSLSRLKYLPIDSDVELGDIVVSAGVGGVYPKGLVIGKVESIRVERGGIYKSCIVRPASRLSGIEEVLCLK